jgi:hypothetical protein
MQNDRTKGDLENMRDQLIAVRNRVGAKSDAGGHISNLVEQPKAAPSQNEDSEPGQVQSGPRLAVGSNG